MKHKINIFFATAFLVVSFSSKKSFSQAYDSVPIMPSINMSGPRFGFTIINGALANELAERRIHPVISQFGWQFETRFFTMPDGTSGLIEWVLLAGGIDQNVFLPSASCLVGVRRHSGLEFGFGPNLSLAGIAFAYSAGFTLKSNHVNFPINLAVVPSSRGTRISLLIGFNARKK